MLHSAHQGVTAMNERAKAFFWLGLTNDIQGCQKNNNSYNLIAPSNPDLPPKEQLIPSLF